jgi:hypothetical protein
VRGGGVIVGRSAVHIPGPAYRVPLLIDCMDAMTVSATFRRKDRSRR